MPFVNEILKVENNKYWKKFLNKKEENGKSKTLSKFLKQVNNVLIFLYHRADMLKYLYSKDYDDIKRIPRYGDSIFDELELQAHFLIPTN